MSDAGAAPDEPDAATAPDAGAIADAATAMEPEPTSVDAAVSIAPLTAAIPCGAEQCDPMTGAYCCISTLRNAPDEPLPEDLHCVTGESSCALALRCSSDNECAQGEACCGMGAATRCVAAASCSGGLRLGCESARDCPANTFCCAHIATDGRHYTAVSCDAQCSVLDGRVPLCDTTNDCTSTDAPRSCRISYVQPNLHVCLP
jgi:hypothetical protein